MIRVAILVIIVAVGAIFFLPQTVAAFPSLEGVVGSLSTDIANVRESATGWIVDSFTGAFTGVLGSFAESAKNAVTNG